ncbi:hypothetical protein AVEN_12266-1 [Araneus ventricosus]|uniref:Uncharacterized protein n=1 Tax=Araneus ventricosus TaxID=182803 RepID=A0A4Y2PVW4_ARAVE|nr:hypothetical protein AVEN_12266-1 [Araneus ventricosus]
MMNFRTWKHMKRNIFLCSINLYFFLYPKHNCDWTSIHKIYSGRNSTIPCVNRTQLRNFYAHSESLNVMIDSCLETVNYIPVFNINYCFFSLYPKHNCDWTSIPQIYSAGETLTIRPMSNRDSAQNFYAFQSLNMVISLPGNCKIFTFNINLYFFPCNPKHNCDWTSLRYILEETLTIRYVQQRLSFEEISMRRISKCDELVPGNSTVTGHCNTSDILEETLTIRMSTETQLVNFLCIRISRNDELIPGNCALYSMYLYYSVLSLYLNTTVTGRRYLRYILEENSRPYVCQQRLSCENFYAFESRDELIPGNCTLYSCI